MGDAIWGQDSIGYGSSRFILWGFIGSILLAADALIGNSISIIWTLFPAYSLELISVIILVSSFLGLLGFITFSVGLYGLYQRYDSQIMLYACIVYVGHYFASMAISFWIPISLDLMFSGILNYVIRSASFVFLGVAFLSIRDRASNPTLVGGFGAFQLLWVLASPVFFFASSSLFNIALISVAGALILATLRVATLASEWKRGPGLVLYD